MNKGQFWIEESSVQSTTSSEDVNVFCFTGFRFIFDAESHQPQAFESHLALDLE